MSGDLFKFDVTAEVRALHNARRRRRRLALYVAMATQAAIVAAVWLLAGGHRIGHAAGIVALEAWAVYLVLWMVRRA